MSSVPRTEYPRPQFRRENWTNLNGEWRFAFDDEDRGRREGWQNTGGAPANSASTLLTVRQPVAGTGWELDAIPAGVFLVQAYLQREVLRGQSWPVPGEYVS